MSEEEKKSEPEIPPEMTKMTLSPEAIAQAAAAGARLLADKDLKVPLADAQPLQMLSPILNALAAGVLAVVGAEQAATLNAPPKKRPVKRPVSRGKGKGK